MKINTKSRPTEHIYKYLIMAVGVAAIIGLSFAALELTGVTHLINKIDDDSTQLKEASKIDAQNKKDLIENKAGSSNTATDPSIITNHKSSDIILSTQREANDNITIIARLKNYSDGTCDLTIKNGDKTYMDSVPVIYQPEASTCAGFNVPIKAIGSGSWQISLSITSKGQVASNSISVEVQ